MTTAAAAKNPLVAFLFGWLIAWYESRVDRRDYLSQVLRKARRFWIGSFRPRYVQSAIAASREGDCHRCGLCCQLVYKCPFLGRDSQNLPYCRIYGELRPANCRNYPFDARDAEIETCGYKFKDAKAPQKVAETV